MSSTDLGGEPSKGATGAHPLSQEQGASLKWEMGARGGGSSAGRTPLAPEEPSTFPSATSVGHWPLHTTSPQSLAGSQELRTNGHRQRQPLDPLGPDGSVPGGRNLCL